MENHTSENSVDFQKSVDEAAAKLQQVRTEIAKKVIGQDQLVEGLLIGLIGKGHVLLEGLPGLAKTLTVQSLSETLDVGFSRVQFTPDLLPSDLIGTEIFNTKTHDFEVKKGPIFNNFILADEINRAPSKVQSALLEAMAEGNITIGKETFCLEKPFIVLATQNPIEQTGTYQLPEAQLDRFLLKVRVTYPEYDQEKCMYKQLMEAESIVLETICTKDYIMVLQQLSNSIFVSESIYSYVMDLVHASRNPEKYGLGNIKKYIEYGVSPRGGIALLKAARVIALMAGRTFVIPEDVQKIAGAALAHRIVLHYEAVADGVSQYDLVQQIVDGVKVV